MNRAKLEQVFRDVLSAEDDADVPSFQYRNTPGWDSLAHMQLVAELEDTFDVMLETDEVVAMSDFQVARDILARHGVEFAP